MSGEPGESRDAAPAHAARARPSDELLGRSLALVRFLRDGCPWDARQTPESLRPYLLEEAHETADAVLGGDDEELAGELGDLLLNIAFQIVLAEERGAFGPGEVVGRLESKMEARHPHVYGDAEEPPDWEELKAREREDARDGVSAGLEPLSRALRVQQRAAALGFDWPSADGALAKLREEVAEVEEMLGRAVSAPGTGERAENGAEPSPPSGPAHRALSGEGASGEGPADGGGGPRPMRHPEATAEAGGTVPDDELEEELGDVLFAAVNVARLASVHPMRALEAATRKFERRFRTLVRRAEERGLDLDDASLEEMEAVWRDVKGGERDEPPGGA